MKPPKNIESVSIRRTSIADADKVRYRVYKSPTEFIAVIAENALLAVKVSGVTNPHKIVRDLPTEGIAVEAKKMAARPDVPERVTFPLMSMGDTAKKAVEMAPAPPSRESQFVAMSAVDLQRKGEPRARILPPEMLYKIIEDHVRAQPPVGAAAPEASATPPASTPVDDGVNALDALLQAAPSVADAGPTPESVSAMAEALLPPSPASTPRAAVEGGVTLSPEEVQKLLNE